MVDDSKPYVLFDPEHVWKRKQVTNFRAVDLRTQLFAKGKKVAKERSLQEIQDYCRSQVDTLWDEVTRFENPHEYYVDLSQPLWDIKNRLICEHTM